MGVGEGGVQTGPGGTKVGGSRQGRGGVRLSLLCA